MLVYDVRYSQINCAFEGHGIYEAENVIPNMGLSSK